MRIQDLTPGRFLVTDDNQPQRLAWAVRDRGAAWIFVDGRAYRIADETGARPAATSTDDSALALSAPMPATVTAVHVSAGQAVKAGDVLITLEAMKMELPIVAPHDGTVRAIACTVGDLVQPGIALAALDA